MIFPVRAKNSLRGPLCIETPEVVNTGPPYPCR
jgi:hypothetical protein